MYNNNGRKCIFYSINGLKGGAGMGKRISLLIIMTLIAVFILSISVGAATAEEGGKGSQKYSYSLDTVDGGEITPENIVGLATVFVFFNPTDNNGFLTLDDIQYSDWVSNPRVQVVAADTSGKTSEELKDYQNYYGFNDITFCYDKSGEEFGPFIKELSGKINEVKSPLIAITDQAGEIRHVLSGYQKPDYLKTFVEELAQAPDAPENFKRNIGCVFTWEPVAKASAYKIYRADSVGGEYKEVASVSAAVWSDTKTEKDKSYFYKIRSVQEIDGIEICSDFTNTAVYKKTGSQ